MALNSASSPWGARYRSDTEFAFPEDEADTIVRVVGFPRRDFYQAVIWFPRKEHDVVRKSITNPFERGPEVELGSLDRLPLELLGQVLLHLDMRSVLRFREVNLRSRNVVDSLHEYQIVASHGLNLLCTLLRTKLATSVTLFEFHKVLCTALCAICGEFGGFVSLLYWERCCFRCLQWSGKLKVQTLESASKQYHLTEAEVNGLAQFTTLPGRYSTWATYINDTFTIIASLHAKELSIEEPDPEPPSSGLKESAQYMAACALPFYDTQTGKAEDGIACAGCQLALIKQIDFTTDETVSSHEICQRLYKKEDFLDHFRWCQQAQLLWKSSGGGRFTPPELPLIAKGGPFSVRPALIAE